MVRSAGGGLEAGEGEGVWDEGGEVVRSGGGEGTGLLDTMPYATSCSQLPGLRPWPQQEKLPVWFPTPTPGRQTFSSPPGAVAALQRWMSV